MPILAIHPYQATQTAEPRGSLRRCVDSVKGLVNPPAHYLSKVIQDLQDTLSHLQSFPENTIFSLHARNLVYAPPHYPTNFIPPHIYVVSIPEKLAQKKNLSSLPMSVYMDAHYTREETAPIRLLKKETSLSFPGFVGMHVPRYDTITVFATDAMGEAITFKSIGFLARIHQQEIDAQNGIEYLFHLQFTPEELNTILEWIKNSKPRQDAQQETEWVDVGPNPIVVLKKLECISSKPAFGALEAWVHDILPFHHANPAATSTEEMPSPTVPLSPR